MEDLSGIEGEWSALSGDPETLFASAIPDFLRLSAKYHLPMLAANSAAKESAEPTFSNEVDGQIFTKPMIDRYLHCIPELKKRYDALSKASKSTLEDVLEETGVRPYLA